MVGKKLDSVSIRKYRLIVKAVDSLTGSWTDTSCEIDITDINNNYPVFSQSSYPIDVAEDIKRGSKILKVLANDDDSGTNAKILYSLSTQSIENPLFSVDSLTGDVTVNEHLDAEKETRHVLSVTATDQGSPPHSSSSVIIVNVLQVNDNPPIFLKEEYEFFSSYFKSENQFVGRVRSIDKDITDDGKLKYSLQDTNQHLSVNTSSGSIYLTAQPENGTLITKVRVTDGSSFVTADVSLTVEKTNLHKPYLPQNISVRKNENWANYYTLVTQIPSFDKDSSKELSYQMDSQTMADHFILESDGKLFSKGSFVFDREIQPSVIIPIRVTDQGGRFSLANVSIDLVDENDNMPTFEFPEYQGYVKTNMFSMVSLLQVHVVDADEGMNSEIVYTSHLLE